jgi:hypothetical protein
MYRVKTILTAAVLSGLVVLNYGFNNLTIHWNALPLPVGHLLGAAALLAVLWEQRGRLRGWLREPLIWAWLVLAGFSLLHLLWDVPRFGLWAWRDASFVFEGAFLLLGFGWAVTPKDQNRFVHILIAVLVFNLAYSLTYPLGDQLAALTPIEGAFRRVALLGFYSSEDFWLIAGALLFLALRERFPTRWRYVLLLGALFQAAWSFIFQARSAYLGILLIIAVWWFFRGRGEGLRLGLFFTVAFAAFILMISLLNALGVQLQGRIGQVTPSFYLRHLSSIWLAFSQPTTEGVPALGSARWRFDVWRQALDHWLATPGTVIVGEGFGQPLIDYVLDSSGRAVPTNTVSPGQFYVAIRQPHNIHLTILARLGLLGFLVWLLMQMRVLQLFWRQLRWEPESLSLWGLCFYLYGLLVTSVQPWLEFSYGALPFFMVSGFLLQRILLKKQT